MKCSDFGTWNANWSTRCGLITLAWHSLSISHLNEKCVFYLVLTHIITSHSVSLLPALSLRRWLKNKKNKNRAIRPVLLQQNFSIRHSCFFGQKDTQGHREGGRSQGDRHWSLSAERQKREAELMWQWRPDSRCRALALRFLLLRCAVPASLRSLITPWTSLSTFGNFPPRSGTD